MENISFVFTARLLVGREIINIVYRIPTSTRNNITVWKDKTPKQKKKKKRSNYTQTIGNNNIKPKDVLLECVFDTTMFVIK